jgi:hypothetical protein
MYILERFNVILSIILKCTMYKTFVYRREKNCGFISFKSILGKSCTRYFNSQQYSFNTALFDYFFIVLDLRDINVSAFANAITIAASTD